MTVITIMIFIVASSRQSRQKKKNMYMFLSTRERHSNMIIYWIHHTFTLYCTTYNFYDSLPRLWLIYRTVQRPEDCRAALSLTMYIRVMSVKVTEVPQRSSKVINIFKSYSNKTQTPDTGIYVMQSAKMCNKKKNSTLILT